MGVCANSQQHAFGSKEGANQHARGLASFMTKRGGVNCISGVLRTKICRKVIPKFKMSFIVLIYNHRADVECAIYHSCCPALPYPPASEPLSTRLQLPGPIAQFSMHPAYDSLLSHLNLPLAAVVVDFLSLVEYLDRETLSLQLLDPFILDNSVLSIQYLLARCDCDDMAPLDRAFRSACLVFIKCIIKHLGMVSRTSSPMVTRIRRNIELCENVPRPLLIWLRYMGMLAGSPLDEERIRISSSLVDVLKVGDQGFPAWSYLKRQLRQIAWVDTILDSVGENICEELDAVALM